MTALTWHPVPGGEMAVAEDWVYLIVQDARSIALTRWAIDGSMHAPPYAIARQAALYAIQLGGAYDVIPEAAAGVISHLKHAAQQYEAGLDVTGQPAWHHGYQPPAGLSPR